MKKITFIIIILILFITACKDTPPPQPSRWKEIKLENDFPDNRAGAKQVYIGNNKIILFGGLLGSDPSISLSETWEYNIETNEWTEIEESDPHPQGRYGFCMAFDGVDKVVIYAGISKDITINELINDTWEYDINTHIWTEYCTEPDDVRPGNERTWSDMCYGGENGKVIMFAGSVTGETSTIELNDLWEYDTITHTWSEIIVDGNKPEPRFTHNIAYVNNKIVLFGGWVWTETMYKDDTWEFDLTTKTWQEVDTQGNHPPGRHMNSIAKLNDTSVLLFGGATQELNCNNDTWEYNTETKQWTEYKSESLPGARVYSAMCYGGNDNVIMFAGLDPLGPGESLYYGDLWEYSHENEVE